MRVTQDEIEALSARPSTRGRVISWVAAAGAVLVLGWVAWQASGVVQAEWAASLAREKITHWSSTGERWANEAEWESTRVDLQDAIDATPDDAFLYDYMGSLWALRGLQHWSSERERKAAYGRALAWQMRSVALRPVNAQAWSNVAMYRYALQESPQSISQAWHEARRMGPNEMDVQITLTGLALAMSTEASPDMTAWVTQVYRQALPRHRADLAFVFKHYGVAVPRL
jgi:tetratricopeptide (TPR) repeat protein